MIDLTNILQSFTCNKNIFTGSFIMTTLLKKILTTLLLTAIFLLCSCDTETTDTHTDEKTQSPLVGTWETEESLNLKNGFKYIYEINSNGKAAFSMEYISDVNPDGETVLIKKGEYLKVEGTASTTADKITITDMKVANDSTMSKEMIAQMIQEPLDDMEIEYKDLTQTSVKIKNVYCDDDGNEIEEWITLRKVTNTNSNNSNENNDTEYSIIGSWTGIKNLNTGDFSIDFKITYVITEKNFTLIFENITTDEDLKITQTTESTITKFEENKIYLISDNPENPGEKINSTFNYKDLTADSVKIYLEGYNEWITFKKVTNTNNNENNDNGDNKDDDTEYSIIGSWENTQTIDADGISTEMKMTYTFTADKFTATAEYNIMDTPVKDTIEGTITKIENGMVYYTFLSPEDNTTEVESVVIYKDLTADSVKFKNIDAYGNDVWLTFTKVEI